MSTTTPAASAAATEIETTGAPILGFLQLNTSNGKVFLNATAPSSEFQSSTAFDVDGWAPELPYVEVSFTAAGLSLDPPLLRGAVVGRDRRMLL